MPRGELENRDRDEGVGDLPEDLGLERRELFGDVPLRRGVPTDMRSNAGRRAAANEAPLGTPPLDFDVRSIYDSRPVNTRDFNLWFHGTLGGGHGVTFDFNVFNRCFEVPPGFVAVVREITFLWDPVTVLTHPYDGTYKALIDGNTFDPMDVVVGPDIGSGPSSVVADLTIPWRSGEPTKTFMIADQGQFVGVQVAIAETLPFPFTEPTRFHVGFYGNFLQKTNVPANFQIANRAGVRGPPVTLPPQMGELLPKPRRQRVPFPQVPILKK